MHEHAVRFKLSGRFAHFLIAEGGASAPSYPVPPRTSLLGLCGAVLGMAKDQPQVLLGDANLTVLGPSPLRFWHTANLRKDPPSPLASEVKRNSKGSSSHQRNTRLAMEYLIDPSYEVIAALPAAYHAEFEQRLADRAWHFSPCLGLSEHLANLEWISSSKINPLPVGKHLIQGAFPRNAAEIDLEAGEINGCDLIALRMPKAVDEFRNFTHEPYWIERAGSPVPVKTSQAVQAAGVNLIWM